MGPDKRIKKRVKRQYARMAAERGSCCSATGRPASLTEQAKAIGYSERELESVPTEAVMGMGEAHQHSGQSAQVRVRAPLPRCRSWSRDLGRGR